MRRQEGNKQVNLIRTNGDKDTFKNSYLYTFDCIGDFIKYIDTHEPSYYTSNHSETGSESFTGTESMKAALELLEHGWGDGAQKIDKSLKEKISATSAITGTRQRSVYDVVGGNCSVPRYLQGVPTSMIRQVKKPIKQPVTDVYLDFAFAATTSKEKMIDSCIPELQKVVSLENAGTRVNLYATILAGKNDNIYMVRICLKKSTERLNILKLAFPAAHPSMLRRLYFAFAERNPDMGSDFFPGYGRPYRGEDNRNKFLESIG